MTAERKKSCGCDWGYICCCNISPDGDRIDSKQAMDVVDYFNRPIDRKLVRAYFMNEDNKK